MSDLTLSTRPHKKLKKDSFANHPLISDTTENGFPKLYFKNTKTYMKVVARPGSLPRTPKIFHFNKEKRKKESDTSSSFLCDLLKRTCNTDISDRLFCDIFFNSKKKLKEKGKQNKTKEKKKKREKKVKKQKKEGLEGSVVNKKEKERKAENEEEHSERESEEEIEKQEKEEEEIEKEVEQEEEIDMEEEEEENEKEEEEEEEEVAMEEKEEENEKEEEEVDMEEKEEEIDMEEKEEENEKEENEEEEIKRQEEKELMKCNILQAEDCDDSVEENSACKKHVNEANMCEDDIGKRGSCEIAMSHVDIYKVVNKKGVIVHIQHPSKFSFHGEVKVTILSGEVEILGYTLNSSSTKTSVDVYSPNYYTALTVETKPVNQDCLTEEVLTSLKDFLEEEDYNKLVPTVKPNDCILYLEQIVSNFEPVIDKYFDKKLFPKHLESVSPVTESLRGLQSVFTFHLSDKGKHLEKNPEWDNISLQKCTVLCGGKGVGKSTLLKYYINKLVALGEKVLCLDLDPGQPEFSFPGCISAVIIDQPVLGPNFTHITDPIVMTSIGCVNVAEKPLNYLDCVKYVVENCQKNEELQKTKWLVNTMGFCKGLGVDLMITVLKLLNPDTVIEIRGVDDRNNYPFYLSRAAVNSKTGYGSMNIDDVTLSHDLRVVDSYAVDEGKQIQGGLKAKELRDVMAVSYLSKMVSPPFYNFNAVVPYLISFSKVYLGIDFLINLNDVLKAFNGNLVSLSHYEPGTEEVYSVQSEKDEYFKVIVKPKVAPSLGIGLVRGIDCKAKKFYVITPLPIETLNNVNCLNIGRMSPPSCMFVRQATVEGQTVYTTQETSDTFRNIKRMFRRPLYRHK